MSFCYSLYVWKISCLVALDFFLFPLHVCCSLFSFHLESTEESGKVGRNQERIIISRNFRSLYKWLSCISFGIGDPESVTRPWKKVSKDLPWFALNGTSVQPKIILEDHRSKRLYAFLGERIAYVTPLRSWVYLNLLP